MATNNILHAKRNRTLVYALLSFILFVDMLLILYAYTATYRSLTQTTLDKRVTIAHTAALLLEQQFDRVIDIGTSLASRVQFRKLISEGKWEEAIKIMGTVPIQFPFIDRIFIADLEGALKADEPNVPAVHGKSFAFRDWYQGVSREWKPYISDIYVRTAEPAIRVVGVAIPIQTDEGKLLGILLLQINLETFLTWAQTIDIGLGGYVYFVDKMGNVAGNPLLGDEKTLINFSAFGDVGQVIQKNEGVGTFVHPDTRKEYVSAYHPLLHYDWGAVVQQDPRFFFSARDETLVRILTTLTLFTLLNLVLIVIIGRIVSNLAKTRKQVVQLFAGIENAHEGIIHFTLDGTIQSWNKGAEQIFGYAKQEIIGFPLSRIIPAPKASDLIQYVSTPPSTEKIHDYQTEGIKKDRSKFPALFNIDRIEEEGKVVGAVAVIRDITMQREMEKKIMNHTQELELQVAERTKSLQQKLEELSRLAKSMVGRELRMVQLKKELSKAKKSGQK